MTTLSDKFVVEPKPLETIVKEEKARQLDAYFEKRKREIVPIQHMHSDAPLNPLGEALKKVRVA